MKQRNRRWTWIAISLFLIGLVAATPASSVAPANDWHVAADVAESCSCDVTCPCNFGSSPTHDYCHGNRLYEITKGHVGDTDVTGLKFMVTFSMREWAKLYVSDQASDAQMEALEALTPHVLGGFANWGIVSTEKAPLTVERSKDNLKFGVPESSVDMSVMKGFNDNPVTVHHLPSAAFQDYTQYKSVKTRHQAGEHDWEYSGTTGFTSKMDVRGNQ